MKLQITLRYNFWIHENKLENGKFTLGLFNKRNNLAFNFVRIPYKSSNLPFNMFHFAIGAETLHIAKVNNCTYTFIHLWSH